MVGEDTIAAIATPGGSGGIGIVRLSGPEAERFGRARCGGLPARMAVGRLYRVSVLGRNGTVVDQGLAVRWRGPRSATGEDVFELHCHGGRLVLRAVLEAVLCGGARGADRGEFTERAFLNGKLDLAEAEAVADLVEARSMAGVEVAAEALGGALSREVEEIRLGILGLAAELEARVDFVEEELGEIDAASVVGRSAGIRERLDALVASYGRGRLLREGARVVLVGKPNVGKSSLMNRLIGVERSIVTEYPGTTRDTLEETLEIDGIPVVLVDTAGVRESGDPIERLGVERTRGALAGADLVVVVVDGSATLDEEDSVVRDATQGVGRIAFVNKQDRGLVVDGDLVAQWLGGRPAVVGSAHAGTGLEGLREAVARELGGAIDVGASVVVTRDRQRVALEQASEALGRFECGIGIGTPIDLVLLDVRVALDALAEVVGETTAEDVLDRVFSEFCIGK